jgi:hypothetical protein
MLYWSGPRTFRVACVMVLYVLIPAAWMVACLLGLTMCRLASRSDDRNAVALAEWFAAGSGMDSDTAPPSEAAPTGEAEPPPARPVRHDAYRATG